jgi:Ca2+/Na+ antiporter
MHGGGVGFGCAITAALFLIQLLQTILRNTLADIFFLITVIIGSTCLLYPVALQQEQTLHHQLPAFL